MINMDGCIISLALQLNLHWFKAAAASRTATETAASSIVLSPSFFHLLRYLQFQFFFLLSSYSLFSYSHIYRFYTFNSLNFGSYILKSNQPAH